MASEHSWRCDMDLLLRRRQMTATQGIQRIEWLGSDSKAYIDTGISGGIDTLEFEIEFSYSSHVAYGAIYGNYVNDQTNGIRLILEYSSGYAIVCNNTICTTTGNTDVSCGIGSIHQAKINFDEVSLDGSSYTITRKARGNTNSGRIALFNRSLTNPNTSRNIGLKIFSFKIRDNGVLLRDFIPVRVGNDGYMYDNVSRTLFGNIGTGNFILGQDI